MRAMLLALAFVSLAFLAALHGSALAEAPKKIPIVYSTDLFHPHADPDDHYDLACLFAIAEFDIRGVVLDLGQTQAERCGRPAVEQMMHLTGRRVPWAIGLSRPLRKPSDTGLEEPDAFQGGVNLILSALRGSPEKVVLFSTGSCRDLAAAFNRQPDLMKAKVAAVYFNIGRGPKEQQEECNVGYDPAAYLRLFESGLPLYWCPCFGKDGYETLYVADQTQVVEACAAQVQNFFVYCLTRSTADPISFLSTGPHLLPAGPRNMWCTAPMLHAAGRKVYQRGPDDFVALGAEEAERLGLGAREVAVYQFVPMRATARPGEPQPETALAETPPGQLAAAYAGRLEDRVGTAQLEPDGRPDCRVRVSGLKSDAPVKNIVLTGPKQGRWEYVATGRWWRVAQQRTGQRLDGYFQFWAPGEHQIEIVYEDGSSQTARFHVPRADPAALDVQLNPPEPNGFVFRHTDPRYRQIMASCLKNLLAGLGRSTRGVTVHGDCPLGREGDRHIFQPETARKMSQSPARERLHEFQ